MNREEELQKRILAGEEIFEADALAYKKVFDALRSEQAFELPASFADDVLSRMPVKKNQSVNFDYVLAGMATVSIFIAAFFSVHLTGFKFDFGFLTSMAQYAGIFIFATVAVVLFNLLDKRLLSKQRRFT